MYKKFLAVVPLVAMLVVPGFALAQTTGTTSAPTIAQLEAQIQSLLQLIAQLQIQVRANAVPGGSVGGSSTGFAPAGSTSVGPTTWCHTFNSNLSVGSTGSDVTALQTALAHDGENVSVTGAFGPTTASAVSQFQVKYAPNVLRPVGLTTGTGIVGSATRAQLNTLFPCKVGPTAVPPQNVSGTTTNGYPPAPAPAGSNTQAPYITGITPQGGPIGTQVTIAGGNFASTGNTIQMNGQTATSLQNLSSNGTMITFTVPSIIFASCTALGGSCLPPTGNGTAVVPGPYNVGVVSNGMLSNRVVFTVAQPIPNQ